MLKLLLKEDRQQIRSEYLMRLAIVSLTLLLIVLLVCSVLIFTTHIQVSVANSILDKEVQEIQSSDLTKSRAELASVSSKLKQDISQLSVPIINPSLIISHVIDSQPEGISINGIHIIFKDKIAETELEGIAKTRSDLVLFQKNILADTIFNTADIPYSNFTKNEDVPFNIKVVSKDLIEFTKHE